IDMEETRNQKSVEGRLKDAMKTDRARIQLGRISAFGLLELSRQRLRSSLIEASTQVCPHCNGTGTIRSTESTALAVLRALAEEGIRAHGNRARPGLPRQGAAGRPAGAARLPAGARARADAAGTGGPADAG